MGFHSREGVVTAKGREERGGLGAPGGDVRKEKIAGKLLGLIRLFAAMAFFTAEAKGP